MTIPANIILEDSFVLGWKFSNYEFVLLGEFRNINLEFNPPPNLRDDFYFKWQNGELVFKGIKSASFSQLDVSQGKDGEMDFGSPDIIVGLKKIRIELARGFCEIYGDHIDIKYIAGSVL